MPKRRLCTKCRKRPVRAATQYYCRACHAAAERPYRAKAKKKLAALYRELAQLRAERTP